MQCVAEARAQGVSEHWAPWDSRMACQKDLPHGMHQSTARAESFPHPLCAHICEGGAQWRMVSVLIAW